jgi:hypothetical protein
MADIGLYVQEFETPLPLRENSCLSFDLSSRIKGWSDEDILVSRDTVYIHGTADEIHAFGKAIVKATEGLVDEVSR